MTLTYQRYHSDIKLHFQLGGNPKDVNIPVPRSTRHEWMHEDFSDIVEQVTGLTENAEKVLYLTKDFMKNKPAQRVYEAFLKITSCYQLLISAATNAKDIMKNSKKYIVSTVQKVHSSLKYFMPLKKIVLSLEFQLINFTVGKLRFKTRPYCFS